jgi:hypothetical protein
MKKTKKNQPAPDSPEKTYQLKIELEGISPPIWRRLQVPGDANLGWLHAAIQVAMGWTNSHLHQFIVGDRIFSDPVFEMNEFEDDPPVLDEHKTLLMDVAAHMRSAFRYQYDFGDSWEHIVKVEAINDRKAPRGDVAKCLEGARACPPEDCGGPPGYADLLEIIKDPKHDEYESTLEWLGGGFDPEAFSAEKINKYLPKLKWPRTTSDQLGRLLMQRDNVRG